MSLSLHFWGPGQCPAQESYTLAAGGTSGRAAATRVCSGQACTVATGPPPWLHLPTLLSAGMGQGKWPSFWALSSASEDIPI